MSAAFGRMTSVCTHGVMVGVSGAPPVIMHEPRVHTVVMWHKGCGVLGVLGWSETSHGHAVSYCGGEGVVVLGKHNRDRHRHTRV